MSLFTPTLYQHLATDYQRNLAVTAGAGTGKTAVLTRRIIKILTEKGHFLDRLLVVTFTDKAAVEMKERIYGAIEEELARTKTPHLQKLKDTFFNNYISTFHAFCAALLREYPIEARLDPYFRVLDETDKIFFLRRVIHKTLRELARDKENQDIGLLSGEFSRNALTEAIFTIIQKREDTRDWMKTFPHLKWEEYQERLLAYRECILREMAYKLYKSGDLHSCLEKLQETRPENPEDSSVLSQKRKKLLQLIPSFLQGIAFSSTGPIAGEELVEIKEAITDNAKMAGAPPKAWQGEAYEQLKGIFITLRYLMESIPLEEFDYNQNHEEQGFALLQAMGRLTRTCLHVYQEEKARENYLDFQDLQLKVIQLLETGKHPHIVEELQERFQYIMVDEFQDTNALQWRIIKRLAAHSSGHLLTPKLFVVGDEKQAIYAFRGGDVSLFSQVRQELKKANRKNNLDGYPFQLQLDGIKDFTGEYWSEIPDDRQVRTGEIIFAHNFRSAQEPIDFFNVFFSQLLYKEVYEEYDARPQMLRCSGNKNPGTVELMLVDNTDKQEEDGAYQDLEPHYKEALLIVDKLKEVFYGEDKKYERVRENAKAGKPACAILLNRRTKIKEYEEALRMNRIDFTVVRGRGFYQRQEIVDLGNLLRFLTVPADDRALTAFLRSPIGHVSDAGIYLLVKRAGSSLYEKLCGLEDGDPETKGHSTSDHKALLQAKKCLSRWFALSKRMPLMEFLQLLLHEGGFYVSLSRGARGQQALSNVDKLLDSARDLSLQEGMDLADFSVWLDNRIDYIEEEGEADMDISLGGAVQIMTVHQAKGLEFPLVFVPDLGAIFNLGERNALDIDAVPWAMDFQGEELLRKENMELGLDAPNPEKEWESEPILMKRIMKKRLRDKLIAEKKRLLYVAATRAMDHLILVGNSKFSSPSVMQRIQYAPLEALTNWMDWINRLFQLSTSNLGVRGTIHYSNRFGGPLKIPYRMFLFADSFLGSEMTYRTEFPLGDE